MSPTQSLLHNYALQFVGLPYIWGGDDPIKGFDCSGLVQELLSSIGLDPQGDQNAHSLYWYFKSRSIAGVYGCGSLVFYGTLDRIIHIAMMVDDKTIVEAGGGGSKTLTIEDAASQNAYVRLRPVHHRKDMVDVILPFGII